MFVWKFTQACGRTASVLGDQPTSSPRSIGRATHRGCALERGAGTRSGCLPLAVDSYRGLVDDPLKLTVPLSQATVQLCNRWELQSCRVAEVWDPSNPRRACRRRGRKNHEIGWRGSQGPPPKSDPYCVIKTSSPGDPAYLGIQTSLILTPQYRCRRKGRNMMDPCPTSCLDAIITLLGNIPDGWLSENQNWHVRDAVDSLRVAREECCLNRAACSHCDDQCGDLSQP
jgi:hypothetical protein